MSPVPAPVVAAPAADLPTEMFPAGAASVLVAEPATVPEQRLDPLADPLADPLGEPAGATVATWPCLSCGEIVPIDAALCGHCGASFLPSATMPTLKLPGLGVIANLEGGAKAMVIIGGAVVITVLFFLAAFVLGSLL